MTTEDVSPRYLDLDLWDDIEGLRALYEGQLAAVAAVGPVLPAMAVAVDAAVLRLRKGGRLIYAGAGTSGRIAAQDGAELAPTFGWPRDRVAVVIAGGDEALLRSIENVEDSSEGGAARIAEINIGPNDVVIGVAASGATPFTIAAVQAARGHGALTVGVANNSGSRLLQVSDHPILLETSSEPIAGSTRLKAGTAQKVALNLFSTMVMTRLGRVYRGLMVEIRPTNDKLRRRSIQIVIAITGCREDVSVDALARASGDVKLAALIASGLEVEAATVLLYKHDRNLRLAIAELPRRDA